MRRTRTNRTTLLPARLCAALLAALLSWFGSVGLRETPRNTSGATSRSARARPMGHNSRFLRDKL